ncbi:hypothetical protein HDE77_001380 [Rhodanobacter sp. MP7CTX1]|nr:hypothetical protein [Rhodanobacter sp. MP7CTX1]
MPNMHSSTQKNVGHRYAPPNLRSAGATAGSCGSDFSRDSSERLRASRLKSLPQEHSRTRCTPTKSRARANQRIPSRSSCRTQNKKTPRMRGVLHRYAHPNLRSPCATAGSCGSDFSRDSSERLRASRLKSLPQEHSRTRCAPTKSRARANQRIPSRSSCRTQNKKTPRMRGVFHQARIKSNQARSNQARIKSNQPQPTHTPARQCQPSRPCSQCGCT